MAQSHSYLTHTTFFIQTYGCQMNKHDSERIAGMLESLGSLQVSSIEESDIVVFMTCCVREAADVRLMGQVNTIKNIPLRSQSHLEKRIIAIGGCIGQRDGEGLIKILPHVDIVFGTHNLNALPELLAQTIADQDKHVQVVDSSAHFPTELPTKREHSWAAWLPITIGCNNFCSYCIVPYVRGREKSRAFEDIVEEAQRYVDQGVKEITLLGQNVNSYGRDLYGDARFDELLDAVSKTGITRLRFATSHPKDLNDTVIEQFATLDNLMPALHLPVQSGSNRILKAMNRRYTVEHYKDLIVKLREAVPNIALSTDIIVGFPGETEQDFKDTYDLVKEIGYTQVFTFIYSKREGTPAAKIVDNTPREVIQKRFDSLLEVVQEQAYLANQSEKGSIVDVLIEGVSKKDNQIICGKSPKNQTVHAHIPEGKSINDYIGSIVPMKIDEAKTWYLKGTFLDKALVLEPLSCLHQPLIVIAGPTASGKSDLAQDIAEALDGFIISADSMQVYRGMDIGTGKVLEDDRRVVHYGLDIVDPDKPYSVALFQTYARKIIDKHALSDQRILLCGGTGFYIRAVVDDYDFPKGEQIDNPIRDHYHTIAQEKGSAYIWDLLEKKDPQSAHIIEVNDTKRIIRAFELLDEGTTYAENKSRLASIAQYYPACMIGLYIERDILRSRICKRVDEMFAQGFIEETQILLQKGFRSFITSSQAIGYKEIIRFIDGEISKEEALDKIKTSTCRYAKRQMTWFRKDKRITWIDSTHLKKEEILQSALSIIRCEKRNVKGV